MAASPSIIPCDAVSRRGTAVDRCCPSDNQYRVLYIQTARDVMKLLSRLVAPSSIFSVQFLPELHPPPPKKKKKTAREITARTRSRLMEGKAIDCTHRHITNSLVAASFWLHCALSLAAQCIVISPVSLQRAGVRAGVVCGLWVCYHDNSKLRASIFSELGL